MKIWMTVTLIFVVLFSIFGLLVLSGSATHSVLDAGFVKMWLPFRIVLYSAIVGLWSPLTKILIEIASRWSQDPNNGVQLRLFEITNKKRWQLAIAFVFIEVIIFEQGGLVYGR